MSGQSTAAGYAGLVAGYVGLYQVNVSLPVTLPSDVTSARALLTRTCAFSWAAAQNQARRASLSLWISAWRHDRPTNVGSSARVSNLE